MLGPDAEFNLKKIDPSRLSSDATTRLDDFFLVLAVVYNDLKTLIHIQRDYLHDHPKPVGEEESGYLGDYNGTTTYFQKTLSAFLYEFFEFIKEYKDLDSNPQFLSILHKLDPIVLGRWDSISKAALEKVDKSDTASLGYRLCRIRDNVAYHYYGSIKVLKPAFKRFFVDKSNPLAKFAYYSLGQTMENTRFFYADAAVQNFLMEIANQEQNKEIHKTIRKFQDYIKETEEIVGEMNQVLYHLLRKYIELKHDGKL